MQGSASFLNRISLNAIILDHALVLIVFITIITVSFAVCKVRPRPPLSLETSLLACHPFQVKGCRLWSLLESQLYCAFPTVCAVMSKGGRAVMQGSASFLNRISLDAIILDHALVLIVFITIITVSFAVCKVRPRSPLSLETSLLACHPFQVKGCRLCSLLERQVYCTFPTVRGNQVQGSASCHARECKLLEPNFVRRYHP